MTIRVNDGDLASIAKKLDRISSGQGLQRPMTRSVEHLRHRLGEKYPPKTNAFSLLATPAQKKAYWAKVSSGEIDHRDGIGYVRTGTLGRKWTTKVTQQGRLGYVGNNAKYGQYVQGERQQSYHAATGWRRTDQIVKATARRIYQFFEEELRAWTDE